MSRYDKNDPKSGSFRAPLNAAMTATSGPAGVTDLWRIFVMGLNSSGRLIKATTTVLASGIYIAHGPQGAGQMVDCMTAGEVAEIDGADIQGGAAPTAGQKLYLDTTASRLTATVPAAGVNGFYVGQVALDPSGNPTRLIVRCQTVQGA